MRLDIMPFCILMLAVAVIGCDGVEVAQTPPMGWNSWNFFACDGLNETVVLHAAQAMLDTRLLDAGYEYVNLDNCWAERERDSEGYVVPRKDTFPNWQAMIDKLHHMGFKFGLYTDYGLSTCGEKEPGSYKYEMQDAKSYAAWQVDYVKDDDCNAPLGVWSPPRYKVMSEALKAAGRPMVFSVKQSEPIETARAICNMRRVGHDIKATFYDTIREVETSHADGLAKYAGPGFWNDLDMLEVGNGNLTLAEEKTHMAFWCLLKSPIILGNDLSHMTNETVAIISNGNAIAVNQDRLGVQGTLLSTANSSLHMAIAIMNNCSDEPMNYQSWRMVSVPAPEHVRSHGDSDETTVLLHNRDVDACLSSYGATTADFPSPVQPVTMPCDPHNPNLTWTYDTSTQELRSATTGLCLTIGQTRIFRYQLMMQPCKALHFKSSQKFTYTESDGRLASSFIDLQEYKVCLAVDLIDDLQVWSAPLAVEPPVAHRFAAVLFNRAVYAELNVTMDFNSLGITHGTPVNVQDVWSGRSLGNFTNSFTQLIAAHGSSFIVLTV